MFKKSLIFFIGGILGIILGKLLEKDREATAEYMTNHNIPA